MKTNLRRAVFIIFFAAASLQAATLINLATQVKGILAAANGGTGVSSSGTAGNLLTSNGTSWVSSAPPASTNHVCGIIVGADNGNALTNSDLGPQGRLCEVPASATVIELDVAADAGTPSIIPARNHAGTLANIVSSALATAASGGIACANTTGGTSTINGVTACSATLQNTSISSGDYFDLVSGTAGGTAKRVSVFIIWR